MVAFATADQREAYVRETTAHEKANGWRPATRAEINACLADKPVFNGCTRHYLGIRYGEDNVKHVMGVNFFIRAGRRN